MDRETLATKARATAWIVEDNVEYRQTISELFEFNDEVDLTESFGSGEELFAHLNQPRNLAPDIMLVDISLPGMDGIEIVDRIHGARLNVALVMLTQHEDNDRVFRAICAGATGYLLKSSTPDEITRAVDEARKGGAPMSPQIARRVLSLFAQFSSPQYDYELSDKEKEVLRELIEGKTKKEIAQSISRSPHTVDSHLRSIYQKLHVHSRTEAVVKAIKEGLISLDD